MADRASVESPDDGWHVARLIPAIGIRGQEEQEKRATSSLLAVMRAVPEFGKSLVAELGAPRGRISTFSEVRLKNAEGKVSIPDGAIVVAWGKNTWRALLEVKTGTAALREEQVGRYVELARTHGFNAVVTISNDITPSSRESPVKLDRRKLSKVNLRHLSWWRVITEAVVQHRHRGVSDPDQAFILGELLAYLDDERSGAGGFADMGEQWVRVREAARDQTLRADADARAVAERWEQFIDYLCLSFSQELGRSVEPVRPRKQAREESLAGLVRGLAESGRLVAEFRVPDAVAPVSIEADLRNRRVTTRVRLPAPQEGRARGRIGWMLRQLKEAPADLRIEVSFVRSSETTACLLPTAIADPKVLLCPSDTAREPRAFDLVLARPMGKKRGRGEGSFVSDTRQHGIVFYRELVQDLKAWRPPAPKLPEDAESDPDEPQATTSSVDIEGERGAGVRQVTDSQSRGTGLPD